MFSKTPDFNRGDTENTNRVGQTQINACGE